MDYSGVLPVPRGDATAIDVAGGRLRTLSSNIARLGQGFRAEGSGMAGAWQSPEAASLAVAAAGRLAGNSTDYGTRLNTAAVAVETYAAKLREAQAAVRGLQYKAAEAEREATAHANQPPNLTAEQRSDIFRADLDAALVRLQGARQQIVDELAQAAQACAQSLQGAIPGYQPGMSPDTAASAARTAAARQLGLTQAGQLIALGGRGPVGLQPPAAGDPRRTAQWWRALNADQQAQVLADSYRELGNTGGVPGAVRSQANEMAIAQDVKSADEKVRNNAENVKVALDRARQQVDPVTGQRVTAQLLVYDPLRFGGDGRAAISVGDVDAARNLAVSVPGITNSVASRDSMISNMDSTYNLYDEARKADPRQSTAVVAWMGYNAPSDSDIGGTIFAGQAREGAQYLAADVNGLRANYALDAQPHVTVIGHSYGSVTTGFAASQNHLAADDIVVLGSPGTTVSRASELNIGAAHVWVGSASLDPVSQTGYFGVDPAQSSYGGTRFRAENEGLPASVIYDHVHYFDRQSESLYNMSQVVTGRYGEVQDAARRFHVGEIKVEPEAFRTVGHPTNR